MLNFQIETKQNKTKSLNYKTIKITNEGKKSNVSYKTINMMYKRLLDEGYDRNKIYIKVANIEKGFTLKSFDDDMYGTLDEYYKNSVKNTDKFNKFSSVTFGVYS